MAAAWLAAVAYTVKSAGENICRRFINQSIIVWRRKRRRKWRILKWRNGGVKSAALGWRKLMAIGNEKLAAGISLWLMKAAKANGS
jgi:hypothetical protein